MLSTSDDTDLEEVRAISPDQRLENAGRNVELAVSSRLSLLKVVRMPPLRAYYRHRFARIGHGPTEAEDLLQEGPDRSPYPSSYVRSVATLHAPGSMRSLATNFSIISGGRRFRSRTYRWGASGNSRLIAI